MKIVELDQLQRHLVNTAQNVTTGCHDCIDYFKVPSHLMAALALALDEILQKENDKNQALVG